VSALYAFKQLYKVAKSMDIPYIRLDQFMKLNQLVASGGEAKWLIQNGEVWVNGERELRRGRKLVQGDRVTFERRTYAVDIEE
jgi:ribosome-associated protein